MHFNRNFTKRKSRKSMETVCSLLLDNAVENRIFHIIKHYYLNFDLDKLLYFLQGDNNESNNFASIYLNFDLDKLLYFLQGDNNESNNFASIWLVILIITSEQKPSKSLAVHLTHYFNITNIDEIIL